MYSFSQTQAIGHEGEKWAYNALVKHGYEPQWMACFEHAGCDMKVRDLPIEVKLANPTKRKRKRYNRTGLEIVTWYDRWQWLVSATSHNQEDWILLLIVNDRAGDRYPYIVPGGMVLNRRHIQITSHPTQYNGWLSPWLNNWQVIDYLADKVYQNGGPLFAPITERMAA